MTITGITILNTYPSPNTDGLDQESCHKVHISDCHIDCSEDCISIKSGKNAAGRNLTMVRGHAGVALGSEVSDGVRDVSISRCTSQGTDRGISIKTRRGRGGIVEGVVVSNIAMQDVGEAFTNTMFYENPHQASDLAEIRPVDEGTPR